MAAPTLSAEAALGQSVPTIAFQSNMHTTCVVGQKLKFASCNALTEPDETVWHTGNSPHGISLVATCPKAQLFAFTERTLEPCIYVCSYPDMLQHMALELSPEATAPLEFTAIAFSRSGEQLAALCGLPEPTLVVWSIKSQTVLTSGPLLVPTEGLSFNPAGDGLMCTRAPKRLLVWNLKLVYQTYLLESTEARAAARARSPRRASATACACSDSTHGSAPVSHSRSHPHVGASLSHPHDRQPQSCVRRWALAAHGRSLLRTRRSPRTTRPRRPRSRGPPTAGPPAESCT